MPLYLTTRSTCWWKKNNCLQGRSNPITNVKLKINYGPFWWFFKRYFVFFMKILVIGLKNYLVVFNDTLCFLSIYFER